MTVEISPAQLRLLLSGTIMMFFFGLILSLPPLMWDPKIFPGAGHMVTLHLQV